jgi:putative ABC transport system permease protein
VNGFQLHEHVPSILVASLAGAFGVALLQITGNLAILISSDEQAGSSAMVALVLQVLAGVFIVISTYVAAVVTANTFSTIVAGRTREIALLRLIGATASRCRRDVAVEGLIVGALGSVFGTIVGTALAAGLIGVSVATGFVPQLPYVFFEPVLLVPIGGVVLTTWLASWVGSRRVLSVSPMQATGVAVAVTHEAVVARRARNGVAIALVIVGGALLALGMVVGLSSPLGVLIGVLGGILSFTGIVMAADVVMPPALRLVGRMLGSSPSARLAAQNAMRYPQRAARTTIGLVIGVTLVTMFAVAAETFAVSIRAAQERMGASDEQLLNAIVAIFSVLIGFSALIAAVGMVNNLSLSILQRTRELGLLRALGFSARQLTSMVRAESAQLTIAALLVGLVLGILYGWAGAQSLLGAIDGFILPSVPLWLLGVVAVAAAALTIVASIVPARRATRISPVVALAVD